MEKLSVFIITFNEAANIRACLQSVQWADEVVIVDAESTDETLKICGEYTENVYIRKWPGYAEQKKYALQQCSYDWILNIDADERISPELREEIVQILSGKATHDGYLIPRRSYFLGRWIRHAGWYPGYQMRLFRKSKTQVSMVRVHEGFLVQGSIGKLAADIDHYSHPTLFQSLAKLNRYSSLEALDRLERGKKVRWYDFLFHPLGAFLLKYVRQKGFLDGMPGFLLSWISAFLKMVMYMKIRQLQRQSPEEIQALKEAVC
jgi:glycosyltransferase involved in cell wall biosynthesis